MLRGMDGGGSGGRLSACIEGAVLLVMLAALGLGLLAVHTDGGRRDNGEGRGFAEGQGRRDERAGAGDVIAVARRAPVHLVVLVDVGQPLAGAVEFSRALDSGPAWLSSVEVVEATEEVLLGLREAIVVSGAPCAAEACRELVVVDLRVRSAALVSQALTSNSAGERDWTG
jgi:hypothetical protein